jgi:hypothetical protein
MKSLKNWFYLVLIPAALAQQTTSPQAPQPLEAQKPGTLEGRVVHAKTGEPVRRVNLTLRPFGTPGMVGGMIGPTGPMAPAAPYAATTDAEGKFRIENVEPGSYRMMAERQGFVRQEYGARQSLMMGTTIKVAPGQELKGLDFKLTPQAVITGRVVDEEGEPLARVQIQVMRQRYFRGRRQLMPQGGGMTIDTGEFRIADLGPGRYWLSASYRGRMMMFGEAPARNTGDKPEEEYVTTYYPNAVDPQGARHIDVVAGQEIHGMDMRMQKARVYRIRGKVTAPAPLRNVRLALLPRDNVMFFRFMMGGGAMVREDGTFEIGGVQPGSYYVAVLPMQGGQTPVGKVLVDVTQQNVENVLLTLTNGVSLTGSIRVDGDVEQLEQAQGKKLTFGSVRVQLTLMEGMPFGTPAASAKEDGTFVLENVSPDKYRIMAFGLPQGVWVKSIRAGDREVLDDGLDMGGGVPGPVLITLGVGVGQISGMVQDVKQQPAAGSLVTLLPDPLKEERNDLYRMTTADQNGQFTMQGIPPGEYKLIAWEDVDPGAYMDPEFLKPHESRAQRITVQANSPQQVSLTQIPAEASAAK